MPDATVRRRLNRRKEPPEGSVRLRLIVAAMVMVAVGAVVAEGALDAATSASALVLIPVGYAFSYVRRAERNIAAKILLALGLFAALGAFLHGVRYAQTVDEARMPLASLFVWVQTLHSFDVPRRRDLSFSVVSSLILIAEAGSLSFDTGLALFLVPWAALAAVWLHATQRPALRDVERPRFVRVMAPTRGKRGPGARSILATTGVVGLAIAVVFLSLPRLPGTFVRLPPFALRHALPVPAFDGSVVNPSLPSENDAGFVDFAPVAYPGFGSRVDLRARGRLSERLVMLVRTPQAALWRGQVYDTFDGTGWTQSDASTLTIGQGWDRGFQIPAPAEEGPISSADSKRIVTTFYVQAQEPNIVFAAFAPEEVFFPAAQLSIDPSTSIRSPILLDQGLVYSVVSEIPVTSPQVLRSAPATWPTDVVRRYTQLPADLPTRDVALARRITAGATTTYDEVMAVQRWLQRYTRYDLGVPRDPPGVDAVDEFLYVRRRGFCEHIASAMAVLLRAVGVPTRFVTGFGPGERNPLTGYFEVREADAHAWLEVLYPGVGWVPYDPTFGVPAADPGVGGWFVAPEVLRSLGRWVGRVIPAPVRAMVTAAGRSIRALAEVLVSVWPWAIALVLVAAAAVAWVRGRRRGRAHGPPATGAAAAFVRLVTALASRGVLRAAHQTPSEYLGSISRAALPREVAQEAGRVIRAFERERFSSAPPDEAEVRDALDAAGRAASALERAAGARRG